MAQLIDLEKMERDWNEADVKTLDGIMKAFYDVISGPAGQPRDWKRDQALYAPGARLTARGVDANGTTIFQLMDKDGFRERSEQRLLAGFFEYEIHRITRSFGKVTHVFSTYEARKSMDGPVIARGVNSVQLIYAADRWWIVSAAWDSTVGMDDIPAEFLS